MQMRSLAETAARIASAATMVAVCAVAALAEPKQDAKPAEDTPAWDRIANIKGAAERIGRLHRARGATAAYQQIENCYKTHSLASAYGEGFEACLAQDYLETRTLIQVYSRMPPDALAKSGVPSPQQLADSMGQRISIAFTHYKKTQAFADEVKRLVDVHGLPVFLAIVFPEAAQAIEKKKANEKK
jgi:cell pole-organizing protein PopZ